MAKGLWIGLLLSSQALAIDWVFVIPNGASQSAVQEFGQRASELLPLKLREELSRNISVEFKDLGSKAGLPDPCVESKSGGSAPVVGRSVWSLFESKKRGGRIELHRSFLDAISRGPSVARRFGCGHGDEYQWALATLIHEVLHLYDFALDGGPLSDNKQFLNLAGWQEGFWGPNQKNTLRDRSPDPYEFSSPRETLAVNFEYFLLDPEFRCRRPALNQFFESHFDWVPFEAGHCSTEQRVFLSQSGEARDLDPSRVYQVHYLFAARGEKMMSRWGHAMYRLVVCAPEREQVGPDCLKDLHHHLVLSYRANVADLVIDYWGGLFGKYPSQLFVYTLSEIIEEYTKGELRELRSLPIRLNSDEVRAFVQQSREQYWAYLGRYYFFSNNCATEACDLLQATQSQESEIQRIRSISPLGLYDELIRRGAVDTTVLEPRSAAIEQGFVFASFRDRLEPAWAKLRAAGFGGQHRMRRMEDYWLKLTAEQRLAAWEKMPKTRALATAFWLMETHVKRRLEKQSYDRALGLLLEQESSSRAPVNREKLQSLKDVVLSPLPWARLSEGARYGVPLQGELAAARDPAELRHELREIYSKIRDFVAELSVAERDELSRVDANLRSAGRVLRTADKQP